MHEFFGKHDKPPKRIYKIYNIENSSYIYFGVCSCGSLLEHGETSIMLGTVIPVNGLKNLDWCAVKYKTWNDFWHVPIIDKVKRYPHLLAAYKTISNRKAVSAVLKYEQEVGL